MLSSMQLEDGVTYFPSYQGRLQALQDPWLGLILEWNPLSHYLLILQKCATKLLL
jgi:hypothetical protein